MRGSSSLDIFEFIELAPIFAFVILCAQHLRKFNFERVYCFFLDNLFLNINIANALLALRVLCINIMRKNAVSVPDELIKIKNCKQSLIWNSIIPKINGCVLCFVWQDNNAVLGITTAYTFSEKTFRNRRRPGLTSTNAKITRPVFGDAVRKWLEIPTAIDDYNHHMNGVDINNDLRQSMTVCRPFEHRNWRPLWLWLLDICLSNAYLLWKGEDDDRNHRGQVPFRQALVDALLGEPMEPRRGRTL
jgi:hypothetical protein